MSKYGIVRTKKYYKTIIHALINVTVPVENGAYHKDDKRMPWRACVAAQSRQNIRWSHTQNMDVDECLHKKIAIYHQSIGKHARLKIGIADDEKPIVL